VALLALLTACASASAPGTAPGSGTRSTSSSATPTGALRAAPVGAFVCSTQDDQGLAAGTGTPVTVPSGAVQAFLLCPLPLPTGPGKPVLVVRADPGFSALLGLLSSPDQPPTAQACAMYADAPQVVLARTAGGAYAVHIPVDGCGHYQHPEILGALRTR
jgi:hypothetical protein